MAYRAARDRRVTPYQAQYFWHCAQQRRGQDNSAVDVLAELPRPLALVGFVGFFAWASMCLVMLLALLAIALVFAGAVVVAFVQTL